MHKKQLTVKQTFPSSSDVFDQTASIFSFLLKPKLLIGQEVYELV